MIWGVLIGAFLLICCIIAFVLIKNRDEAIAKTPVALANQILRYPERILVDVPLYVPTPTGTESYHFLLETEAELASIGELEMRRQFVLHFAEVTRSPSIIAMKDLTTFLFNTASEEFRETLHWDDKCINAMLFLEFLHELIDLEEKGFSPDDIRKNFRKKGQPTKVSKELRGNEKKISQEWANLNNALYGAVVPTELHRGKTSKKKHGGRFKKKRERQKIAGVSSSPISQIDTVEAPHLVPFQRVANEVYKSTFDIT